MTELADYVQTYEELEAENEALMNTVIEAAGDFRNLQEGYEEMVEIARTFLLYREVPDESFYAAKDRFLEVYHIMMEREDELA